MFRNILNYTRWTNGDKLSLTECKDLFEFLELEWVQTEERLYGLEEFGFSFTDNWYEVFKSDPEESLYIKQMLSNGE